jgi:O-antigen ligase
MTTMSTVIRTKVFDLQMMVQLGDWLAVGVAVSLPWSTSATAILIALWLAATLPTINAAMARRVLATPAGGLPVLLWALAALGMLWADVTWSERFDGLGGFLRLLAIPLLLAQFGRSPRGTYVLYGFLASTTCLLIASWSLVLMGVTLPHKPYGVPVKDYIFQSGIFLICAIALIDAACDLWRARGRRSSLALAVLAVLSIANIGFVATGRTVLLVVPFFAIMLGWREGRWKGILTVFLITGAVAVVLWLTSPYLRERMIGSEADLHTYLATDAANSTGQHLEFLKKSMLIVEEAPYIGHGTGSIAEQFRRHVIGQTGAAAIATVNPHNQIFAVAIPLGLLGAGVLLAMWASHLMLFRGGGFPAWIGALVVVQNIVSSLVNSHLFDFSQGWFYVFGVGVAGGMVLRERDGAVMPSRAAP